MLGTKIKAYLTDNGITQAYLVRQTGLSADKISNICNQDRGISAEEYYSICTALKLPLDYFFEDEG